MSEPARGDTNLGHTNYYGLVFGGGDLEGPQQKYLYLVVASEWDVADQTSRRRREDRERDAENA